MSHADHVQDEKVSAGVAGSACCKAGKSNATANKAAADAFAASLKPILFELLIAPSHGKRKTPTGWQLTDLATKLTQRDLRPRPGPLFRPTTVMRLLVRMPDLVKAAKAVNDEKINANFRSFLGIEPPTNAAEAKAGMNTPVANNMMKAPKA